MSGMQVAYLVRKQYRLKRSERLGLRPYLGRNGAAVKPVAAIWQQQVGRDKCRPADED